MNDERCALIPNGKNAKDRVVWAATTSFSSRTETKGGDELIRTGDSPDLCSLSLFSDLPPLITLLGDRELDALALGQRNPGLASLADDEDVVHACGEGSVERITDVNHVEAT